MPDDEASLQIKILGTERTAPIVAAVRSVAVSSTPALTSSGASSPDTYAVGEPIYFTATFNNGVAVTGDPEFGFSLGSPGASGDPARRAAYDADRSTPRKLVFRYTVQATDADTNGIWVGDQTATFQLDGNDGILTSASGLSATLTHSSLGTQSAHKVDGTRSPPAGVALDPPLTASLSGPPEHDGRTAFKATLTFSEEVSIKYRTVREKLFTVSGATIPSVRRLNPPSNLRYEVTVQPNGNDQVTLERAELPACGQSGSICTPGGRALEGAISATVPGPPELSVADVRVDEGPNVTADFAVTLSRASTETVTVSYETSDGTATRGEDYQTASGTLTFAPGETKKTVSVTVLDDSHDEGEESFTLTLSNPSGGNVFLVDATATGTIVNTDPMPRAWVVRFGRIVGSHVVEGLAQRLGDGARPHVTVAGIGLGPGPVEASEDPFAPHGWPSMDEREPEARTPSTAELFLGSSFHLSSEEAEGIGAAFTAWGRVATGGFEAEVDDVTMDGDVTTGLLGFDAEWDRALAGLIFSRSSGDGSYRLDPGNGDDAGTVKSDLTGVYPYARLELGERTSAWGLVGGAAGSITLARGGREAMKTDLSLRMGALGVDARVLDGEPSSGIAMHVKTDAMWVRTKSARSDELEGTKGDVTRLRLRLEGERAFDLDNDGRFTASADVGLRHDGGGAEIGAGLEVGAGARYSRGALSIEGQVRTLMVHEASGYREWGANGAIRVTPSRGARGPTLGIRSEWGRTESAAERLWSARDAGGLERSGEFEAERRLVTDVGYGFSLSEDRGLITPYAGVTLGEAGRRTVRSGVRWTLGADLEAGLEAARARRTAGDEAGEVRLNAALRF